MIGGIYKRLTAPIVVYPRFGLAGSLLTDSKPGKAEQTLEPAFIKRLACRTVLSTVLTLIFGL